MEASQGLGAGSAEGAHPLSPYRTEGGMRAPGGLRCVGRRPGRIVQQRHVDPGARSSLEWERVWRPLCHPEGRPAVIRPATRGVEVRGLGSPGRWRWVGDQARSAEFGQGALASLGGRRRGAGVGSFSYSDARPCMRGARNGGRRAYAKTSPGCPSWKALFLTPPRRCKKTGGAGWLSISGRGLSAARQPRRRRQQLAPPAAPHRQPRQQVVAPGDGRGQVLSLCPCPCGSDARPVARAGSGCAAATGCGCGCGGSAAGRAPRLRWRRRRPPAGQRPGGQSRRAAPRRPPGFAAAAPHRTGRKGRPRQGRAASCSRGRWPWRRRRSGGRRRDRQGRKTAAEVPAQSPSARASGPTSSIDPCAELGEGGRRQDSR